MVGQNGVKLCWNRREGLVVASVKDVDDVTDPDRPLEIKDDSAAFNHGCNPREQ